MTMESELILSILSSMAEEESHSISKNNKWSIQKRFEQGTYVISYPPYGYVNDGGEMRIVPEEAEVVRRIFNDTINGKGSAQIARELTEEGIKSKKGGKWNSTTIRGMLRNEKYTGDVIFQKTYTVDCLTKKRVVNDGTVPQYYVNNDHEAIIPRELFTRVQEEMKRRANIRQGMDGKRRVYSSKYALSSIVFCGHCGDMYRRTHWNNHGKKQIVWRCVTRLNAPGVECPARTLSEIQLQNLVLETNISEVLGNAYSEELERIKKQIEKQQTLLVKMTAASEDYSKVVDKIYALQREQEEAMAANVNYKAGKERIQEMIEYLRSQSKRVTAYDE